MIPYAEQTTEELIALLQTDGSQVTAEHIQELVARPEATVPLSNILRKRSNWYPSAVEWWVAVHAVTILALKKDPRGLPSLVRSLFPAWDQLTCEMGELLPYVLAEFGVAAVKPLIAFVDKTRGKSEKNESWSYARHGAAKALTLIALAHPAVHERVFEVLCDWITDPEEQDSGFLSYILPYPVRLEPERGAQAVRQAYENGVIDESLESLLEDIAAHGDDLYTRFTGDFLAFYQPAAIKARAHRRQCLRDSPLSGLVSLSRNESSKTPKPDDSVWDEGTDKEGASYELFPNSYRGH